MLEIKSDINASEFIEAEGQQDCIYGANLAECMLTDIFW